MTQTAHARFAIKTWDEKAYRTEGLAGLQGEGSSAVGRGMEHPFTLSYEVV